MAFSGPPPDASRWQATLQPLNNVRFSYATTAELVHVLLETPSESYVAFGFGPRVPGASMAGADVVMMLLRPDGTMALQDSFVAYDLAPPVADPANATADADAESAASGWHDLRAERTDGITRYFLSRRRAAADRFDNPIPGALASLLRFWRCLLRCALWRCCLLWRVVVWWRAVPRFGAWFCVLRCGNGFSFAMR